MSGLGHNSGFDDVYDDDDQDDTLSSVQMQSMNQATKEKLRTTVARIERLEEEKAEVAEQIKDVYREAKAFGFDTKAIREIIKIRKQDRQEREEREMVLETYLLALGLI